MPQLLERRIRLEGPDGKHRVYFGDDLEAGFEAVSLWRIRRVKPEREGVEMLNKNRVPETVDAAQGDEFRGDIRIAVEVFGDF